MLSASLSAAQAVAGGRSPFWDGSCVDSRPSLAAAGADAPLRAGWLGWSIGLSAGADDLGGPNPRPPSIEKRTDSHVAPLLGMTENGCHCEEARRADAAIRIPVSKAPLCKGSCQPQAD